MTEGQTPLFQLPEENVNVSHELDGIDEKGRRVRKRPGKGHVATDTTKNFQTHRRGEAWGEGDAGMDKSQPTKDRD